MNRAAELLRLLSLGALGVFVGAMLTEAGVLVPYWQSLSAREFFTWYAVNGDRLVGFFGPVTTAAAALTLVAALLSLWERHPRRWASVLSTGLTLSTVALFFLYFERANESFSRASIVPADLPSELARWASWHLVRCGLSLSALGAAIVASRSERQP